MASGFLLSAQKSAVSQEGLDEQSALIPRPFANLSNPVRSAVYTYSFAQQGGALASVTVLRGPALPANSILISMYGFIRTAFAGGGSIVYSTGNQDTGVAVTALSAVQAVAATHAAQQAICIYNHSPGTAAAVPVVVASTGPAVQVAGAGPSVGGAANIGIVITNSVAAFTAGLATYVVNYVHCPF